MGRGKSRCKGMEIYYDLSLSFKERSGHKLRRGKNNNKTLEGWKVMSRT